jgi:hypothetical protein
MPRRCGQIILIEHAPFPGNPDCLVTGSLVSQARKITADRGDFCLDLKSTAVRGSPDGAELQQQLFQVE